MIVKNLFISILSLLSFSCLEENNTSYDELKSMRETSIAILVDSTNSGLNFKPKDTYRASKFKVEEIRVKLRKTYLLLENSINKEEFLDSVSVVFTDLLLNNIVPHWYGTPWDFEGHTSVPNQGEIACGYFVSTTLNHMGLNINRYHLARQGPLNIAIDTNLVLSFSSEEFLIKKEFFSSFSSGLYFVGLDSHVGYLYVYNKQAYFLHSNYVENRVMLEPIELSEAFESYSYSLVKITRNRLLMLKWLFKEKVKVVKVD